MKKILSTRVLVKIGHDGKARHGRTDRAALIDLQIGLLLDSGFKVDSSGCLGFHDLF